MIGPGPADWRRRAVVDGHLQRDLISALRRSAELFGKPSGWQNQVSCRPGDGRLLAAPAAGSSATRAPAPVSAHSRVLEPCWRPHEESRGARKSYLQSAIIGEGAEVPRCSAQRESIRPESRSVRRRVEQQTVVPGAPASNSRGLTVFEWVADPAVLVQREGGSASRRPGRDREHSLRRDPRHLPAALLRFPRRRARTRDDLFRRRLDALQNERSPLTAGVLAALHRRVGRRRRHGHGAVGDLPGRLTLGARLRPRPHQAQRRAGVVTMADRSDHTNEDALALIARQIINSNRYMTLATADEAGTPPGLRPSTTVSLSGCRLPRRRTQPTCPRARRSAW